jgi:hypothetical protein
MTRPANLLLLAAALALSACNRSAGGEPPADLVLTAVAATLTSAPTLHSAHDQTPPAFLPTATPPPSATAIISPSPTSTFTPTVGLTPTITPLPLLPGDPRIGLNLSAPDYRDDFSNQLTWVGPSFPGAENVWDDGRLRTTDYLTDSYIWWSTTSPDADAANVYAEVTAEIGDCAGKDGYGLAVRVRGDAFNSGYTLEFSCDGAYRIRDFQGGSVDVLLDWTPAAAIHPGPQAVNRMGLVARGPLLYAIANDILMGQVDGVDFMSGTYGLFASAEETPGLTIYFDDFALWRLNP